MNIIAKGLVTLYAKDVPTVRYPIGIIRSFGAQERRAALVCFPARAKVTGDSPCDVKR